MFAERNKNPTNQTNVCVDSIGMELICHNPNVSNNLNKMNLLPNSSNKVCEKKNTSNVKDKQINCAHFDWCAVFILVVIRLQIKSFTTHLTFLSFKTTIMIFATKQKERTKFKSHLLVVFTVRPFILCMCFNAKRLATTTKIIIKGKSKQLWS